MAASRPAFLSLTVRGRFLLMVATAALIMMAGTGYAFYVFRRSLLSALGDPVQAQEFLGPSATAKLDGLILDQMVEIALVCLPVGIAFLALAFVLAMGVRRPLKALQEGLVALSNGDFGITVAGAERRDEIGAIARSVADFRVRLSQKAEQDAREAVEQQERMARQRGETLNQVAAEFEQTVVGVVHRLGDAAGRVAHLTKDLDGAVDMAASAVDEASGSSIQASSSVSTAAEAAEEMSQSILSIGREMEQAAEMARAAVEESRSTDAIVGRLAESGRASARWST